MEIEERQPEHKEHVKAPEKGDTKSAVLLDTSIVRYYTEHPIEVSIAGSGELASAPRLR